MSWVKRSGGSGTGFYGQGLAAIMNRADTTEHAPRAPEQENPEQTPAGAPAIPPAYSTDSWPEVRSNRITLEVIANWVTDGNAAEDSSFYTEALANFGPSSPHLEAASKGQAGAAIHYQNTAANGRFRTRNGEYWQE